MKVIEKVIIVGALAVIIKGISDYAYDKGYFDGQNTNKANVNPVKPHVKKKWFDLSKYSISINKKE